MIPNVSALPDPRRQEESREIDGVISLSDSEGRSAPLGFHYSPASSFGVPRAPLLAT